MNPDRTNLHLKASQKLAIRLSIVSRNTIAETAQILNIGQSSVVKFSRNLPRIATKGAPLSRDAEQVLKMLTLTDLGLDYVEATKPIWPVLLAEAQAMLQVKEKQA